MADVTDMARAYAELSAKQNAYDTAWRYYDGNHPLVYSASRLREIFKGIDAKFNENWCAVVIDAQLDRTTLERFTVTDNDSATELLNQIFTDTELNLDAHDTHLAALVCGEAFVIASQSEPGEPVEAYYNDPLLCHAFYDPENPRKLAWAAKWWVGDDELRYITLYYPDRFEYYVSTKKAKDVTSPRSFTEAAPSAPNPWGVIPVFHYRTDRRKIKSVLANAIAPQNAVNKLVSDMMIAAEFGAMKQRFIISEADPGELRNAPGINWWIPAGSGEAQQTSVGQLDATDLNGYLVAIDKFATVIAIITRTPKHFLFQQGGDPSGEALLAMEAPLNKKCERFNAVVSPVWARLGQFLLKLSGQDVEIKDVVPVFADVRTVQPKTTADIRKVNVEAGIPIETQLKWEGIDPKKLEEMKADKEAEKKASMANLATALAEQQRNFDQQDPNKGDQMPSQNGKQPAQNNNGNQPAPQKPAPFGRRQ